MLTRRGVVVLAAVTALMAIAAVSAQHERWQNTIRTVSSEPAFPGFAAHLSDAARIRIDRATNDPRGSFSFQRDGDLWVIVDNGGYPARQSVIREMLIGMSDLELVETKTKSAKRYAKLDLENIDKSSSKATRVVVEDAHGGTLADALFGKRVPSLSGGTPSIYLRHPGDPQSWLAKGEVEIRGGRLEWLRSQILSIARERVARVELTQPDAPVLVLYWDNALKRFDIEDMAINRQVKSRYEMLQTGIVVERLTLDDVKPAGDLTPDPAMGGVTWRTTDGLTIALGFTQGGSNHDPERPWGLIEVTNADDVAIKVREEAHQIRQRTKGWAFRFNERTMKRLRATAEGLTKPKAES